MLKNPLILGNFERGMHISPYSGFSQMRAIDPFKVQGVASIERAPVALTGTGIGATYWMAKNSLSTSNIVYMLDNAGKLWTTTNYSSYSQITGNTLTNAHGNGMVYWKGHVIVVRDQLIDAYKVSNTTWYSNFTSGTATLSDLNTDFNPVFVGQDDKVYIGNNQYVAVLSEVLGQTFDANNTATFTFTQKALTLPKDYVVRCFAELGDRLMIGTRFGFTTDTRVSDIFPWDRDTTHSFSLPIRLADEGINSMLTSNNLLHISSGYGGRIYVSNGSSVADYSSVPLDVKEKNGSPSGLRIKVYPDAIDFFGDELLLGASQNASGSGKTDNPMGVYSFARGISRFFGNGSYAKDGSDGTQIEITSIYAISPYEFLFAWSTGGGASTGIDYIGASSNKVSSYGAYCDTEMFTIGSNRQPTTLQYFDFYLNKPLVSGDGIKLLYRTSQSGVYTTIATLDYATHGAVSSYSFQVSIPSLKTIQFQIQMTATSTTSPELRSIIAQ